MVVPTCASRPVSWNCRDWAGRRRFRVPPIPHPVFPAAGGVVQWASTVEGDACFLLPEAEGTWHVGVWFRQWAQWEEYKEAVPVWLLRQVAATLIVPGLPLRVHGGFAPVD